MARTYAGILALLGLIVVLLRAIKDGAGVDGTLLQSVAMMALLAVVGTVVGAIAQTTVDESTRTRVQAELDAFENAQAKPTN
ncbi:hypothetical protein [Bythopirellula goksoeyrii]|uniref:Uncharacterized protein n=1 Tax=Bythopirellula goksoeyrii TaxID=1400387 RepID=A0A5B9Q5V6_9BACT|nr:hypothetical protein [Bythopirellula goksoeyrii]QEG33069.1 hypothetical protein Pr1d_03300 [Bythopirellula goksoeyrii]